MNRSLFLLVGLILLFGRVKAQGAINRSNITVMVIPYTSSEEDVLEKYESDPAYRSAIADINNTLIKKGYRRVRDLRHYSSLIDKIRNATKNGTQRDRLKKLIEELPVDIVIQAELIWPEQEMHTEKQVQIILQALDKHTATIYAHSNIESYERQFKNLREAVNSALLRDGKKEYEAFLQQMEMALAGKRELSFRFELASVSPIDYDTKIDGKSIRTWVAELLNTHIPQKNYRINGESQMYIQGSISEPITDEESYYLQPCHSFCSAAVEFFREKGLNISYTRAGKQLLFKLKGVL